MDPLLFAATCTICLFGDPHFKRPALPMPGTTIASDPWAPYIAEASSRFSVPEAWVREVMRVESGGRTHLNGQPITSSAGAMGLMQVMPSTYEELRQRHGLGDDPHAPRDNILAGAAYLRQMYDRFGAPGFLAAYNAGPRRFEEHLAGSRPLPPETQVYVARVAPRLSGDAPVSALAAVPPVVSAPLFDPTEIARAPIFVALTGPLLDPDGRSTGASGGSSEPTAKRRESDSSTGIFAVKPAPHGQEVSSSNVSQRASAATTKAPSVAPSAGEILIEKRTPDTLFVRKPPERGSQ